MTSTSVPSAPSKITIRQGDLFSAPAGSLLIHACNCQGSWGSGVAAAFKARYPAAYSMYRAHCQTSQDLLGTTLLIPPQPADKDKNYIACLFTSTHYGRRVDPPAKIATSTEAALVHLASQVDELESHGVDVGPWHLPKINSLRFRVPWETTLAMLERTGKEMTVWVYEEEDSGTVTKRK